MSQDLIRRADAVRARNKLLESVPGSGYHDDDRDHVHAHRHAAPQRNGLPRISDHIVPFYDHQGEDVVFAGEDATRALQALHSWRKKYAKLDPSGLTGTERKLLLRIIPRAVISPTGMLAFRLDIWNDVLYALQAEGVGLSGLPLEEA